MSKYHVVSSGMVTRQALPSITRQRGTTTGSANVMLYGAGKTTVSNNTTFIDSSANAFTIARSGDTVQSGFNPFSQASSGSGYFDGNGDYLTVNGSSGNAAFTFGTGDVTIECWAYHTTLTGTQNYYRTQGPGANAVYLFRQTNGQLEWAVYNSTGTVLLSIFSASSALTANTWNHVAIVRSGNTHTFYVNGVASGSPVTASYSAPAPQSNIYVGKSEGFAEYMNGYISNLRVVKGTAVYTSNFTPPTSPLTAITNTSLLLLTDNYSIVNSTSTNLPVTINGNTTISTAQYPTGMSSSIYFDGTGDYLSFTTFSPFTLGAGAFTLEFFVNSPTVASNTCIIDTRSAAGAAGYFVSITASQQITFNYLSSYTSTTTLTANTWTHVAIVRIGSTVQMYINGVAESGTFTSSATITAQAANIGQKSNTSSSLVNFSGYLSNIRVVQGSALYSSNFTPPSLPMSTTVTVPAYVTNAIYGVNQIP
jgi:Concanavalin A-like lectin/glucanases superfamily